MSAVKVQIKEKLIYTSFFAKFFALLADQKHSTYPCTYSFLTNVQIISAYKMSIKISHCFSYENVLYLIKRG